MVQYCLTIDIYKYLCNEVCQWYVTGPWFVYVFVFLVFSKANTDHHNILMKYVENGLRIPISPLPNPQILKFTMTTVYTGYTSCFWCGPCCSSTIFVGFWVGFFRLVLCAQCCQYLRMVKVGSFSIHLYYYKHTPSQ